MMLVIGLLLALGLGLWFGRRLGPALVAAVMVMAAQLWLVGGFVLDLLRKLPAGIRWVWFALLRALGVLAVLPLTPFVFVWAFLAELFRPKLSTWPRTKAAKKNNGRFTEIKKSALAAKLAAPQVSISGPPCAGLFVPCLQVPGPRDGAGGFY